MVCPTIVCGFESKDRCFFGTIHLIYRSPIDPKFDIAWVKNDDVVVGGFVKDLKFNKEKLKVVQKKLF